MEDRSMHQLRGVDVRRDLDALQAEGVYPDKIELFVPPTETRFSFGKATLCRGRE